MEYPRLIGESAPEQIHYAAGSYLPGVHPQITDFWIGLSAACGWAGS
jgi:hypothetical protein